MAKHFRISLEPAAGKDDRRCAERYRFMPGADTLYAGNRAVLVLNKFAGRCLVKKLCAVLLAPARERFDQRQAAADRRHTRLAGGDEISRRKIEFDAEGFEPGNRRTDRIGEGGDDFRIGEAECLDDRRPVLPVARGLRDQLRVEVMPGIGCEMRREVVGGFAFALHAQQRIGPAGIAAALVFGRAFEDRHAGARLQRRCRCRQPGNAAADNDDVEAPRVRHLPGYRRNASRLFPAPRAFCTCRGRARPWQAAGACRPRRPCASALWPPFPPRVSSG
jgi:hypothetical protein